MMNKKMLLLFVSLFTAMPAVDAGGSYGATYVIISLGIFIALALFTVTFILWRTEERTGPWILVSFAALSIVIGEVSRAFFSYPEMYQLFMTAAMVLLFIVSAIKLWDALELTE